MAAIGEVSRKDLASFRLAGVAGVNRRLLAA
jgi:hypothetical protein